MTMDVRLASIPGSARILRIVNDDTGTSVTAGNLQFSSGKLVLRNGTNSLGASPTLATGTVYRVGIYQRRGATSSDGVLEGYLAEGDAPFGAPFFRSTIQNITTPAKRVEVGATNSVTLDATFDGIVVDIGSLPGRQPARPFKSKWPA